MYKERFQHILSVLLTVYVVFMVGTYFIAGDRLEKEYVQSDAMLAPSADVGEIVAGTQIRQPFTIQADRLTSVTVFFATYDRENTCTVRVWVENSAGTVGESYVYAGDVTGGEEFTCYLPEPWPVTPGEQLWLCVASEDAAPGNALSMYYGSNVALNRGQLEKQFAPEECVTVNGEPREGVLCYHVNAEKDLWFGRYYIPLAAAGFVILVLYMRHMMRCLLQNKPSRGVTVLLALIRYRFLMEQLVARDFKAKYKRSILGVVWSFLNPFLTLFVQYVVFSTIFKSSIENYALYLLIGIVCYNFFSEATGMALTSILGNASLITKVYVPKYIFPITRTISSGINLAFSMIPILLVIIAMRVPFAWSYLLVLYALACLVVFAMGVGMFLSAIMVFFRDVQFIWSVLTMIIFYGTPILYPEQLLSGPIQIIFKINPLYHVIRFIRVAIMDGVSPAPQEYLLCFLGAALSFGIGAFVFKRLQDRFALNL